ncbi:MAG: nitroreductase family protein [Ktedonobacterales bacterium]|nr:nitroreductase family protein [Ktedonobacterales bacterium]
MPMLNLAPDELLTTTRSVRKRLDFSRPVEPDVIRDCLRVALQAPTGSNAQRWHFVVVTDAAKRQALGDLYRKGYALYRATPPDLGALAATNPARAATMERVITSSDYLAEHMHEAPVLLIPCIAGRTEGQPSIAQAALWGSIIPAAWSFMLAARARGLGTSWTTLHLFFEQEAAHLLGIPFEKITQVALIPVAYTKGTDFSPAPREPLEQVLHWDAW